MCFRILFLIVLAAGAIKSLRAQQGQEITGFVYSSNEDGKLSPLPGVHIIELDTTNGVTTNTTGFFSLYSNQHHPAIAVSYIGYETDTIDHIHSKDTLIIVLKEGAILADVEIVFERGDYYISRTEAINAHTIGQGELRKAACCSLAESFETNPSIDGNFTDAITGTRQIRMLGLSGKYVQIMQDNIPTVRGLSTILGLSYIPGAWINSIQVSKGAGSVVNGFESTTGQINLEMKKPGNAERFHLNLYGSAQGRLEANAYIGFPVKKHWETTLLAHVKNQQFEFDQNNDRFLDQPLIEHTILRNEWKYAKNNTRMEYGISGLLTSSKAGTVSNQNEWLSYLVTSNTKQLKSFAKIGYLFPKSDYKSLAIQLAGNYFNYVGNFGNQIYEGNHISGYINTIFQDELSEHQTYKTGLSGNLDIFDEIIDLDTNNRRNYKLDERVVGSYFEYTISKNRFSIITGLRADYNFIYGGFLTPRLHARYNITESTIVKVAAGKGTRTPNVIMENLGLLASNRSWNITNLDNNPRYGLTKETAWNLGIGLYQDFKLNRRGGSIKVDAYSTQFTNQVVIDREASTQSINIYNLQGRSFANSIQTELNYKINKRLDVRLAYRYLDVKTTYNSGEESLPFVAKNRAFASLSYESRKSKKESLWKADLTTQWIGQQRIPNTLENPIQYQLEEKSPDYFLINGQITRIFNKQFEVYLGGENLTNYKQENPIVQAENPNGNYFDSAMIWGPIMGANYYLGLRWTIQ